MMCHSWRRKSLFTAIKKVCRPSSFQGWRKAQPLGVERGTDPRWCSARRMIVCALWRSGYGYLIIAGRSANIRLQLPCIRGAVSLSRVEKKQYIVQSSSNPVGRKSDASIENSYPSNRDSNYVTFYLSIAYSIDPCNIMKSLTNLLAKLRCTH